MAGRPGRNRAWNKIPVEEHVRRGTYRADRHGPLPGAVPPLPLATTGPDTPMPPELLAGLSGPGLAFVTTCWDSWSGWTAGSLVLLREVGVLMDQLETLRGHQDERATQRLLVSLLKTLRLDA